MSTRVNSRVGRPPLRLQFIEGEACSWLRYQSSVPASTRMSQRSSRAGIHRDVRVAGEKLVFLKCCGGIGTEDGLPVRRKQVAESHNTRKQPTRIVTPAGSCQWAIATIPLDAATQASKRVLARLKRNASPK